MNLKTAFVSICMLCTHPVFSQTQNTWVEKNGVGLNAPASSLLPGRYSAVAFSIGNTGYIGTGCYPNDFWQYNPVPNTVEMKAAMGFASRGSAVGFSIGNLGYIGTGSDQSDFWEYDPAINQWTQKSSFPGGGRRDAVGFSIGTKGYLGTGTDPSFVYKKDFWEYDPAANLWTQKADFGGTARTAAIGFSIGTKGYIGTGAEMFANRNDFWEYNPATNAWVQKANFGGGIRTNAVGIAVGSKGYVGLGLEGSTLRKDFWEYNPATNLWTQKTDFGGDARYWSSGFGIGTNAYVGFGTLTGSTVKNDLWEFNTTNNTWTQKLGFQPVKSHKGVSFSIGNSGFTGTGLDNTTLKNDFWQYDQPNNTWTQKPNFGGTARSNAAGFSIGNKGYIGTGTDGSALKKDLWEYDLLTNIWTQKADFGGVGRQMAAGFSIGNRGYIGTGFDGNYKNDFWEYNPILNSWTQKANFAGGGRWFVTAFSIGNKGYMGTGQSSSTTYKDLWEYDPVVNSWVQKANMPGASRLAAVGFSCGDKGFVGTGAGTSGYLNDFAEYNPVTNTWTQRANMPGLPREDAMGFSAGGKAYICCGLLPGAGGSNQYEFYDLWEYTPVCSSPLPQIYFSGNTSICTGDSVFLYANSSQNYQWLFNGNPISGATSNYRYVNVAGSYSCIISNACGTVTSNAIAIQVNSLPGTPGTIVATGGNTKVCPGESKTYSVAAAIGATSYTWIPPLGSTILSGQGTISINLSFGAGFPLSDTLRVVANNACGISVQKKLKITRNNPGLPGAITTVGGVAKVCPGDIKMYSIVAVTNAASYTWISPVGSTITTGQGTNAVTVEYNSGFVAADTLRVRSENACGSSAFRILKINRNTPATPGVITGDIYGLCNMTSVPYSVTNVAGINYNWVLANGSGNISTGQGTNSVTVNFNSGNFNDSLKVTAYNGCGTSAVRKVTVKAIPATPVSITGTTSVCLNQQGVPYSITPIASATTYTWTGPTGSHISDGSIISAGATLVTNANMVTVNYATSGGGLKVRANNSCGSGSYRSISVAITCREMSDNIPVDFDAIITPNPVQDRFTITLNNNGNEPGAFIIRDSRGAEVFTDKFYSDHFTVEAGSLAPGIYIVEIRNTQGVEMVRLVKN